MKRKIAACVATLSMLGMSAAVTAHHSTAMYDYRKSMTMTGTVTVFQWTNPHMFIKAKVPDAAGKEVEWNIECGTPNINGRHGWKRSDLKPGDKVVMDIHPMLDGTAAGTLVTVKLPDGRTLHAPGGDIVTTSPAGPQAGASSDPAPKR